MKDRSYWIWLIITVVLLILTGCGATGKQNITSEDPVAVYSRMSDEEKAKTIEELRKLHQQTLAEQLAEEGALNPQDGG